MKLYGDTRISGLPVSRKQGKMVLPIILKSGYDIYDDDYSKYYPEFQVWNIIPEHDWKNHSCNIRILTDTNFYVKLFQKHQTLT